MRDIGFVSHDFKCGARWDRHLPDELFPRRLDRRRVPRRQLWIARGGLGFQLEARRRVIDGPRLVMRRWMNAPARKNLWLGVDANARFDDRRGRESTGFAAGDVRGADRSADEAHHLQVERGNNQAGGGFETHAMPKAKPARDLAGKFSEAQIMSVNAGETNSQRFSRTIAKPFRL